MKVEVNITRRDLIHMNLFLWPKIRWNWISMCVIFIVAFLAGISTWHESGFSSTHVAISLGIAAVLAIAIQFFAFLLCLGINLIMASEKTGLGKHEYTISPEGLQETTALNSELSKWASFDRVFKSKRFILLKKHWAALHIFPARSFETREHFESFYGALVKHVESSAHSQR